ncbi:MAG: PDZ domain-containing protein, partial [Oscillospiraceae bacterium]|nr:PDZ domain-containing protein [Oscillospiraceae bacterium]
MEERRKQKKRFGVGALIGTAAATLVVTLIGLGCAVWLVLGRDGLSLLQGITLVKTQFVGEKTEEVTDQALSGMIEGLGDRWSYYLDEEAYQAEQERRANVYVGIGVTVDYTSEAGLTIRAVVPGGSAEEAGLVEGEIITAVDGEDIAGEARYEAPDRIAGEEGSTVRLTVQGFDGNRREVELVRKSIQTDPVSYEYLENGVGYVKLSNFFAGSAD